MNTGKLLVIDGNDGSGKQTQTKLLIESLEAKGHDVVTDTFPKYYDNFFGKILGPGHEPRDAPASLMRLALAMGGAPSRRSAYTISATKGRRASSAVASFTRPGGASRQPWAAVGERTV